MVSQWLFRGVFKHLNSVKLHHFVMDLCVGGGTHYNSGYLQIYLVFYFLPGLTSSAASVHLLGLTSARNWQVTLFQDTGASGNLLLWLSYSLHLSVKFLASLLVCYLSQLILQPKAIWDVSHLSFLLALLYMTTALEMNSIPHQVNPFSNGANSFHSLSLVDLPLWWSWGGRTPG